MADLDDKARECPHVDVIRVSPHAWRCVECRVEFMPLDALESAVDKARDGFVPESMHEELRLVMQDERWRRKRAEAALVLTHKRPTVAGGYWRERGGRRTLVQVWGGGDCRLYYYRWELQRFIEDEPADTRWAGPIHEAEG